MLVFQTPEAVSHGQPAIQAELLLLQGTVLGPYLICGRTSVSPHKNYSRCALRSHYAGFWAISRD